MQDSHIFSKIAWWIVVIIIQSVLTLPGQAAPAASYDPIRSQWLNFEHLTSAQGLLNERVQAIVQDQQGFLWFGTQNGLFRYDGYTLKHYQHDSQTPGSLPENSVFALQEDRRGNLWIGTQTHGLWRFDHATEQFRPAPGNPAPDITTTIYAITEDRRDTLWIGTSGEGLYRLDPDSGAWENDRHDPANSQSISSDDIACIFEDHAGVIWVGTWNGLNRFNPYTRQWTVYLTQPEEISNTNPHLVLAIAEDRQEMLWLTMFGSGLYRFDPRTEQNIRFMHDPENPHSLSDNKAFSLCYDRAGELWVGTMDGVLHRFEAETGDFTQFRHNPLEDSSLGKGSIWEIYEDRSGSLWLGVNGWGLSVYHRARTPFRHYTDNPLHPERLSDAAVRPIYQSRNGAIWIGTVSGGLNRLNPHTGEIAHYRNDPSNPHSLSDNGVYAITEDRSGAIWIGTYHGLNRFDPTTQQFARYFHDPENPDSLSRNFVYAIVEDSQGNLWIGTDRGGLNRFEPATGKFHRYFHEPESPDSLSDDSIFAILIDRENTLWLGTKLNGLIRFDPDTGHRTRYRHHPDDPTSLSHDTVYALHEDRAGHLWIGTLNGLNRLNPESEQFTRYTQQDGLPSETITSILEEPSNVDGTGSALWLGTLNGLVRFESGTGTIKAFDRSDGLLNQEYDFLTGSLSDQGELWFGGPNGIDVVDPSRIVENPFAPPVVLTDFEINNQPVPIGGTSVLQRSISMTETLTLSHKDRVLAFEFAALNFIAPAKNQYQYILEGFDAGWVATSSDRRRVTYTNLDAGRYVFRVRGSNNAGVWNDTDVSLTLTITPPWWHTRWFYAFCVITVLGVFGLVYWNKTSQLQRERTLSTALRKSELQLSSALKIARLGHWELDVASGIFTFSDSFYEIFRTTAQKIGGYTMSIDEYARRFVHPEDRVRVAEETRKAIDAEKPNFSRYLEHQMLYADGSTGDIAVRFFIEKDDNGKTIKTYGVNQDITERKKAEESLARERVLLKAIIDNIPIMITRYDPQTNLLYLNKEFETKVGWTTEEAQTIDLMEKVYPDPAYRQKAREYMLKTTTEWQEFVVQAKSGAMIASEWSNIHLNDGTQIGIGIDISDRKRMETALRESLSEYRALFENMTSGFAYHQVVCDENGKPVDYILLEINTAFEKYTGIAKDMLGKKATDIHPGLEHHEPDLIGIFGHVAVTGKGAQIEYYAATFHHWYNVAAYSPKTGFFVTIVDDITDRKQAEDAIRVLNADLEQRVSQRTAQLTAANKELESFAYIVSHDLKAPLRNVIQLVTWLVQDYAAAFDDTGKEYANLLIQRVKRMDNLINGVLEYSRVGRMSVDTETVDLNILLPEVIDTLAPPPHITITLPNALPTIAVDRIRITQVFQNLLGNAIKFLDKPHGEIGISCADAGTMWQFRITDNGPGIEPQHQDTIFQIFRTNQPRDMVESTGIGLTIVKKIVEFYGGAIGVESEVGQGSTFVFTLPKTPTVNAAENIAERA